MTKQKTIPELQAEIAANERQLAQLQHKQQQLENRRSYYEKGDRRKRAHRLITRGAAIYFNFVGRFVPPAFGEVELTPEELEEIRKREERKDRLHQNYLKRKASGAQKRYEDKIKGRKKQKSKPRKPPFVRRILQRACSFRSAVYRRESRRKERRLREHSL